MKPYWDNGVVRLYQGDARAVLAELPAESVHCVVTSPPYWGLRSYGHWSMQTLWGASLAHFPPSRRYGGCHFFWLRWRAAERGGVWCRYRCCWIGALGLEPTVELYVEHIVEVFREVQRVLRKDGTCWVNLGDSYAGSWGAQSRPDGNDIGSTLQGGSMLSARQIAAHPKGDRGVGSFKHTPGLKPKDLVGMPWRVAFALQADGWWLRSDIIWDKPNPMPESVRDRPTRSHEYLFLLTKAARYFWDADAIREPGVYTAEQVRRQAEAHKRQAKKRRDGSSAIADMGRILEESQIEPYGTGRRNKRSVWRVAAEPFPEAHFATFPQALVEPCVLAGTSERGVCPGCGAPWEHVVESVETGHLQKMADGWDTGPGGHGTVHRDGREAGEPRKPVMAAQTTGWRAMCRCGREDTVPAAVLDPFVGAGTVCLVAQRLGRRAVGVDLSTEYLGMAARRIGGLALPLALGGA